MSNQKKLIDTRKDSAEFLTGFLDYCRVNPIHKLGKVYINSPDGCPGIIVQLIAGPDELMEPLRIRIDELIDEFFLEHGFDKNFTYQAKQ